MKATMATFTGRATASTTPRSPQGKAPTHPPQPAPLDNINNDCDRARGFRLGDLLAELVGLPQPNEERNDAVREAALARENEFAFADVSRRFLIRNRDRLVAAFFDSPHAERFLLEDLLLGAAEYELKCQPDRRVFDTERLMTVRTGALSALRNFAAKMKAGAPDPSTIEDANREHETAVEGINAAITDKAVANRLALFASIISLQGTPRSLLRLLCVYLVENARLLRPAVLQIKDVRTRIQLAALLCYLERYFVLVEDGDAPEYHKTTSTSPASFEFLRMIMLEAAEQIAEVRWNAEADNDERDEVNELIKAIS